MPAVDAESDDLVTVAAVQRRQCGKGVCIKVKRHQHTTRPRKRDGVSVLGVILKPWVSDTAFGKLNELALVCVGGCCRLVVHYPRRRSAEVAVEASLAGQVIGGIAKSAYRRADDFVGEQRLAVTSWPQQNHQLTLIQSVL